MSCLPDSYARITRTWAPDNPIATEVLTYSKHVQGGARKALLQICDYTDSLELLLFADVAIHPGTLTNPSADPQEGGCWCGYIAYLYRCCGSHSAWGITAEHIRNRIAVSYTVGGEERITPFAQDSASIFAYGQRELVAPLPADTLLSATAYRDRLLAALSQPIAFYRRESKCYCNWTHIVARGWWDTLDWQLYSHPCGYAPTGAVSSSTIPLGQGFSSNQIGFRTEDLHYSMGLIGDQLNYFKVGESIQISGAGNAKNNKVTSIASRTSPQKVRTSTGDLHFLPHDDIYGVHPEYLVANEMIQLIDTPYDGYWWVDTVYSSTYFAVHQDIHGNGVGFGDTTNGTIIAGTTVRLSDAIVNEDPGHTITVQSLTQYICQPICNPCDAAWPVNHAQISVRKSGNPTDSLIIELCTDCFTVVSSTELSATDLASGVDIFDVYFSTSAEIAVGGCLYLRIHRSGAQDMVNFYEIQAERQNPALPQAQVSPDGLTWYYPDTPFTLVANFLQDVSITTQAQLMAQAWTGINTVYVDDFTDFAVPIYRKGWRSIRYELERLIALGTKDGRRLTVTINCNKNAHIGLEPLQADGCTTISCANDLLLAADGSVADLCSLHAGLWVSNPADQQDIGCAFLEAFEVDYTHCRVNYTTRTINLDLLGLLFRYEGII